MGGDRHSHAAYYNQREHGGNKTPPIYALFRDCEKKGPRHAFDFNYSKWLRAWRILRPLTRSNVGNARGCIAGADLRQAPSITTRTARRTLRKMMSR
jgi:hypothetical protein